MILSAARSAKILEEVAAKHGLEPEIVKTTKRDRRLNPARAEVAERLRDELGWTVRIIGSFLNVSARGVCDLLALRENRKSDIISRLKAEIEEKDKTIRELRKRLRERSGEERRAA